MPIEKDQNYDYVQPLPQSEPWSQKKGTQCGECGMKFEYGKSYGFYCGNQRCPTGWGPALGPPHMKVEHMAEIRKCADDWLREPKYACLTVLDPDGWDRKNYEASWAEEITEQEFNRRLLSSTCMVRPAP